MSTVTLKVEGMACSHCQAAVEKALKEVAGVESVRVELANKEVTVTGSAPREQLVRAVEKAGYEVV